MEILAYGEDALTLWAIKKRLSDILVDDKLKVYSTSENCKAFFRPSFGRRGGDKRSEFGEFDFIILSEQYLYLGESKWDKSSEKIRNGELELRGEQTLRHDLFKFYVEEWWTLEESTNWSDFAKKVQEKLGQLDIKKPIARENSLLASNLKTVLEVIKKHYKDMPKVKNVLLYLYDSVNNHHELPRKVCDINGKIINFTVVPIDYSEAKSPELGNFIRL